MDEMWSYVGAKATERWLWHAIDHHTGRVLAYVLGTRKDAVFLKLYALLVPFGITHYYTDKAGVYRRHLPPEQHTVGKLSMQKIERKHLTLRTRLKRLARKTLCFSRSCVMHDLVIGLYMNHIEFGCAVWKGTDTELEHYPVAEYQRCFDAAAIRATCEEFRAAATIDLIHDEADKEQKISCPTLVLWSASSMWATYDILEVWRSRAADVQGVALECGHFLPEEDAERTAAELLRFLS